MSKVIVTGGAGFIGSTLVDKLIVAGHEVKVIDDLSSGKMEYLNSRAFLYQNDIRSLEVAKIFQKEKPEYVFHLAAQIDVRKSMAEPLIDNEINVQGGLNVLEQSRVNGVKKIIFSSTGGAIYGEADEIPTTENFSPYPLSFYGIHKLTFEKYLQAYWKLYGLDYTTLRFANVYGPRQYKGGEAGVVAIFVDNAVRGLESVQYGDGEQTRDFVYIDDVVRALCLAKDIACQGEINIGTGLESSLIDVRNAVEKAIGQKLRVRVAEGKTGEQRRSCLSNQRAKAVLNWEPTVSLVEGIAQTVMWSKEQLKNSYEKNYCR